jgi:hypothetical protein
VESPKNRDSCFVRPIVFNDLQLANGLHFTKSEGFSTGARMTLMIQRSAHQRIVVFALSGRIEGEHVEELKRLFRLEPGNQSIVLNLKDVTLVDQDGVKFLARCEADGWELTNCPAYIREWMARG